ncbi:hypothetical protein BU23DRAFT_167385 [Bimuria novae-zelandiae CBS 107.79]|uniref:Uncharacterized protein n=1 Tax=Bimuria novae-zelandiae CBS 107.79 TaxID=1447943 RepID=A0A6A5V4W1_9PLEO|nr:hypothetical protein BU23DRAFT_167385 [Bimuria novae-zelandiae CBS 107.79]
MITLSTPIDADTSQETALNTVSKNCGSEATSTTCPRTCSAQARANRSSETLKEMFRCIEPTLCTHMSPENRTHRPSAALDRIPHPPLPPYHNPVTALKTQLFRRAIPLTDCVMRPIPPSKSDTRDEDGNVVKTAAKLHSITLNKWQLRRSTGRNNLLGK